MIKTLAKAFVNIIYLNIMFPMHPGDSFYTFLRGFMVSRVFTDNTIVRMYLYKEFSVLFLQRKS